MSLLTVILVLAMLLWALGFVVSGLVLAEEVLWRRPVREGPRPIPRLRKVGATLLLLIGRFLLVTAIATGVLIADRAAYLVRLEAMVSQLEGKLHDLERTVNQALPDPRQPPAGAH